MGGLWPWYVVLGLLSFVLLLFPSGHLASNRWRPVAWVGAGATACLGLSAAFKPRPLAGKGLEGLTNPLGIQSAEAILKALETVVLVIWAGNDLGGGINGRALPASAR